MDETQYGTFGSTDVGNETVSNENKTELCLPVYIYILYSLNKVNMKLSKGSFDRVGNAALLPCCGFNLRLQIKSVFPAHRTSCPHRAPVIIKYNRFA